MACLMNYTVQCRDITSGKKGCFLFDVDYWQLTGKFVSLSPIFPDLESFFAWDNQHGHKRQPMYVERILPDLTTDSFFRMPHDMNGNPCYAVHYSLMLTRKEIEDQSPSHAYEVAKQAANNIGGKICRKKDRRDCFVFQSYSLDSTIQAIRQQVIKRGAK